MGLDTVEMLMAVEKDFDIEIGDHEVSNIRTVGELHGLILRKLRVTPLDPAAAGHWTRLRAIVAEELGVEVDRVTPSARFVDDLGAS